MPGAKTGLVDYISRNPFANANKISAYDEYLVSATISNQTQLLSLNNLPNLNHQHDKNLITLQSSLTPVQN